MVAPSSVTVADLIHAALLAAIPSADLNLAVNLGQGLVTTTKQSALQSSTVLNSARATAPTGGNSIVTLTVPSTGYYQCVITVGFGATAESTTIDNFMFENNGATSGNGTLPVANVANTQSTYTVYAQGISGQSFSVNVGTTGSAGSIYKATIAATRIA